MIQLQKVSKQYENGVMAVDQVSLTIEQGEFVYLVGPSGSGKTTLMKLLYAAEQASRGRVLVGDFNLSRIKRREIPKLRRYVGVVFQDFKLLPKLTVYENVAYAMEVTGQRGRDIRRRTQQVLEQVGLRHKVNQYPDELSGGEQQRVAIARAIANRPMILVTDEPTGNLDPDNAEIILRVLAGINQMGTTVIMGTHNDALVNRYRQRVIRLERGRLMSDEEGGEYREND